MRAFRAFGPEVLSDSMAEKGTDLSIAPFLLFSEQAQYVGLAFGEAVVAAAGPVVSDVDTGVP